MMQLLRSYPIEGLSPALSRSEVTAEFAWANRSLNHESEKQLTYHAGLDTLLQDKAFQEKAFNEG
ncbi:hypothetical protein H6F88_13885 [Oculatella sp. FACHB-28]|uniref:hypothetical protein n=1 Tax=Cyanophyceae TaxID=3028117 RepID=UPI001682FD81|nr:MULTISPECIES: hypothetical protein [Cyanophyceae]MBD2057093.1 hypothetical protein [Oculatella sp. FACHB-28]MBD2071453.1 hypothetical protein [Leptolyngbya sp. FACHB-671]